MRFYEGVVELSLTAAEKKDPQGLGLHFYKNGEPEEDVVGLQAFQERQVCRIIYDHYRGALFQVTGKVALLGKVCRVVINKHFMIRDTI